jgi:hypothetical protein
MRNDNSYSSNNALAAWSSGIVSALEVMRSNPASLKAFYLKIIFSTIEGKNSARRIKLLVLIFSMCQMFPSPASLKDSL